MKNNRLFVPSFLKKIDANLLLKKPSTWASRVHLVFYYCLLFSIALTLICLLALRESRINNHAEIWTGYIVFIACLGFIVWLIYLFRFNPFKRFGNDSYWDGLKSFFLYFVSIGMMASVCYIPICTESFLANRQYSSDELVKDMNEINTSVCLLEYKLLPKEWSLDTNRLISAIDHERMSKLQNDDFDTYNRIYSRSGYVFLDSMNFYTKMNDADSIKKINDSLFIKYYCPNFCFIYSNKASNYSSIKTLYSFDIYNKYLKNFNKPDIDHLQSRLRLLSEKYFIKHNLDYDNYDEVIDVNYERVISYDQKMKKKYKLLDIQSSIHNIASKKYNLAEEKEAAFRFFFYCTFILSLLVFIFRHSTVKTFFLTLLSVFILIVISALFFVAIDYGDLTIFSIILFYYILFSIIALTINQSRIRRATQGIALNIFTFCSAFLPLYLVAFYIDILNYQYRDIPWDKRPQINYEKPIFIAEIVGILLFIILFEPVFKKLYKKWYALPEE